MGKKYLKEVAKNMVQGRCMRCKTQREMNNVKEVTMKNGMKAAKGVCSKCGTNMYKILGKAKK